MQRKATIIGGVAEALHLRISIKKLRQIAVDFGAQQLLPEGCEIAMNDGTGNTETIPMKNRGPFDQLGYRSSIGKYPTRQRPDLEQFRRTKATLIAVCRAMVRKHASPQAKLIALEYSVFNTALWRAQVSPWSLAMCRELDEPINQLLRHITKSLPGHPNNLLYGKSPGLHLPRFSDRIQSYKLALAQRGLTNPPDIAAGIHGHFQRSARFYGLTTIPGNRMSFGSTLKDHWAHSLLERLDECSLYLTLGGKDPTGTHEEQLNNHNNRAPGNPVIRPHQDKKLASLAIHTFGDLLEQTSDSSRWIDTTREGLHFLTPLLANRTPTHLPNVLRVECNVM